VDRLCLVGAQDALILLRARLAPLEFNICYAALLQWTRVVLRRSMTCSSQHFHALPTTLSDSQWLQASLPIKFGGHGIRRVTSLALPAFLASAESTLLLQDEILGGLQSLPDELVESLRCRWVSSYGPLPSGQLASKQSSWDRPGLLVDSTAVEVSQTSPFQRASVLAAHAIHSGDWLLALPITACRLRLDDEAVRIAVALRLGSELGSPHSCRCGSSVDARSTRVQTCSQPSAKAPRLKRVCQPCSSHSSKEGAI